MTNPKGQTMQRCTTCNAPATAYYHDAGPFGAGTFYGCQAHAPQDATPLDVSAGGVAMCHYCDRPAEQALFDTPVCLWSACEDRANADEDARWEDATGGEVTVNLPIPETDSNHSNNSQDR